MTESSRHAAIYLVAALAFAAGCAHPKALPPGSTDPALCGLEAIVLAVDYANADGDHAEVEQRSASS